MITSKPRDRAERPLAVLVEMERYLNRKQHVTDVLEGPCGKPPAIFHRWPPRWHKKKLGEFTLRARSCQDCGLYEGVLYR